MILPLFSRFGENDSLTVGIRAWWSCLKYKSSALQQNNETEARAHVLIEALNSAGRDQDTHDLPRDGPASGGEIVTLLTLKLT